ncbi:unnamed protein product [Peniophora sp. CBMAI 1063]|nr:unnamed protein product [Peniophora sp. CBMAI 1063]
MGSGALLEVDETFYDKHMNINVKGPFFLTKLAAPLLPEGSGRVIFFSTSLTHQDTVRPNNIVYVATKGAIEQITRTLAKDLGAKGITVNCVNPGPTDTPLFRTGRPEEQIQHIADLAPERRLGRPDDISPVVAFLASDGARWVNGQIILLNGGFVV